MCTLYSPNLNALLYQIQNKYFLYFKFKIHVLYFVTFSGTSILYFVLIHLFEGYFVFCIKIHFDVFLCKNTFWCIFAHLWVGPSQGSRTLTELSLSRSRVVLTVCAKGHGHVGRQTFFPSCFLPESRWEVGAEHSRAAGQTADNSI